MVLVISSTYHGCKYVRYVNRAVRLLQTKLQNLFLIIYGSAESAQLVSLLFILFLLFLLPKQLINTFVKNEFYRLQFCLSSYCRQKPFHWLLEFSSVAECENSGFCLQKSIQHWGWGMYWPAVCFSVLATLLNPTL